MTAARIALTIVGTLGFAAGCAGRAGEGPPNVVLIVLDTARWDHFSTYGYERETTPSFEAFAREGIRFDRAYSTSCWNVPSHASLFTGLYPLAHGATQESCYLGDEAVTLAEILAERGYETVSFSSNPWISPKANLAQGFARAEVIWTGKTQLRGTGLPHVLNRNVFEWLDRRESTRPFLLFLNYIEPHWKYQAPTDWQRRFVPGGKVLHQGDPALFASPRWYLNPERVPMELLPVRTAAYDAELAYTDAILDELLAGLRERGVLDGSLVIVTSDHGENHGDNGHVSHIFTLNEATIRIPLVIRLPDGSRAGTVRTDRVQIVDLFPTILAAAGVSAPEPRIPTYDVLAGRVPGDRPVFAEYYYPEQVLGFFPEGARESERLQPYLRRIRSLIVGETKLLWGSDGRHELYDLATDPGEGVNRIAEDAQRTRALEEQLRELVELYGEPPVAGAPTLEATDPELEEQLRSLGYVK